MPSEVAGRHPGGWQHPCRHPLKAILRQELISVSTQFPFELNEQVWIVSTNLRGPLGPFLIVGFLPNNMFRLKVQATGEVYQEAVSGVNLARDPYSVVIPG